MIKKWEIIPSPTDKNKTRHKLLLKCDMKDIFFIVKKLGSICSRPEKMSGDYNFLIYLSKLEMDSMSKLKEVIKNLSDIKEEEEKGAVRNEINVSNEPVFDLNQIKEKEISSRTVKVPPVDFNTVSPSAQNIVPPIINVPQNNIPSAAETPKMEIPLPEVKEPTGEEVKVSQKQIPSPPVSVPPRIVKSPGVPPPSSTGRVKKELPKEEILQKKEEPKQTQPEISVRGKIKWQVELPLNPTLTFQTLIAGPHNRFAHAAAMAVVENPGVMYNPLLIFGPQGIGKSHFIYAMAYGLSTNIGQKNIFVTDAMKLSIGVDLAIKQGWINTIEKILKDAKVVIIDDINLFMLNETNKPYISKLLNECMNANKQIIVSSLFPPKTLGPLEEAIGFQFTQGWMVDIKMPNAQTYKLILNQMLASMDVKISEDDIKTMFMSKMLDFRSVFKILSSARKLEKYLLAIDNSLTQADMIEMLMGMKGDDESYPSEEEIARAQSISFSQEKQWFRWGLFYPKGMEMETKYVLAKIREFAKELNISLVWNQVFIEEYNPDEMLGMPFKIGSFASQKDINGLIIIGPQTTSALGTKEAEFRHLTEKILESFNVKSGWIPSAKLKAKSIYLQALMELV